MVLVVAVFNIIIPNWIKNNTDSKLDYLGESALQSRQHFTKLSIILHPEKVGNKTSICTV
jgi:hypothetical protein